MVAMSWVLLINCVESVTPLNCTTAPFTKLLPVTVISNVAAPAVTTDGEMELITAAGLLMVNVLIMDVPPPGAGVKTVMAAVPALTTLPAGTVAFSWVLFIKMVESAIPFHCTTEVLAKLLPMQINVRVTAPEMTDTGEMELNTGIGALMLNVNDPEVPPPGVGLTTVMVAVPAFKTLVAGTKAVNCVLLM